MRLLQLIVLLLLCAGYTQAQDINVEDLKAMKAEKLAAADALLTEAADLEKQIKSLPGWSIGGVGIIGADFAGNDNWYAINNPFSSANGYGISASAFANKNADKFFWNNLLSLNLKKVNTTLDSRLADGTVGNKVSAITDALDLSSLAGYKLAPKWALSGEAKYTSTLLNFNNPGKLTVSAGATWLPIPNAVVIFHPLAYEFNFPGDFVSVPGCKIGATYAAAIIPGVSWSTNLSLFIPYGAGQGTLNEYPLKADSPANDPQYDTSVAPINSLAVDYSGGGLTNWTWLNSFSTNIFKGIGVGLNVGLRQDAQIANQWQYQRTNTYNPNVEQDNPLQFYYNLGLSYTL